MRMRVSPRSSKECCCQYCGSLHVSCMGFIVIKQTETPSPVSHGDSRICLDSDYTLSMAPSDHQYSSC